MVIANPSDVLGNVTKYLDMVFDRGPVEIPRNGDKAVVLVSKTEYLELEKARRNAEYLAKIERAIAQADAGTMQEHEIIEVHP